MADFELLTGVKFLRIWQWLPVQASYSTPVRTTYFIVYAASEQCCDSFPLNSTDTHALGQPCGNSRKSTLLLLHAAFLTLLQLKGIRC